MVQKGDAYAVFSSDYDVLLHGADRMIKTCSKSNKKSEVDIMVLADILRNLNINREKLIALAMMIGTDYNPKGIKGIGYKRGLKLLRNNSIEEVFQILNPDFDWKKIMNIFQNMEITDDYCLRWESPDEEGIKTLLIEAHDFSKKTVKNRLDELVHLNST